MLGIRVSTLARFGNGHIARCRAVRSAFHGAVRWYVDEPELPAMLHIDGDEVVTDDSPSSIARWSKDLVQGHLAAGLVDLRDLEVPNGGELMHCAAAALADGTPYPPMPMIIDPQLTAVPAAGRLVGPGYVPLDPQAAVWRGAAAQGDGKNGFRLLVAFGAVDSSNRTGHVLRTILAAGHLAKRLTVTVVLPRSGPHHAEVRNLVTMLPAGELEDRVTDMWPIYASHELAIGAPGVSQAERAFCGLPSLLLPQNRQQKFLAEAWETSGSALATDPEGLVQRMEELMEDLACRSAIREAGMALVDGKGAARVAAALSDMMAGAI